ncbi:MAG: hypothetical protein ACTSRZ_05185 [Promethearchaeota archaeon]
MLILTYFHRILGPDIMMTSPEDLLQKINPEYIEVLKNYFDTAEPGFFTHSAYNGEFRTANFFFSVKSPKARGKEELAMITKIITVADPDLETYEELFINFINRIKKEIPDLYLAFYFRNPSADKKELVKKKLEQLREYFEDLFTQFSIEKISTFGSLMPVDFFLDQKTLYIPPRFIHEALKPVDEKKYSKIFSIFQYKNRRIKIEMIPLNCTSILKVMVIFKGILDAESIAKIGEIFSKYKLPLIYTSGICTSEKGDCIYEVYLDNTASPDREILFKELMKVEKIEKVKITLIE